MKTFYRFSFRTASALLILLLAITAGSLAQTPEHYNFNTTSPANSFPFNIPLGKQVQLLFLAGDFNQPSPATAGNITSVSFMMAANLGPNTYSNVAIRMGQTNIAVFGAGAWYAGPLVTVYSRASVSLTGTAGQWLTIILDSPFAYDPTQSLVIEVQQCGAPGATGFSTATTTLPGFRRNTSLVATSCPFPWGQQSGTLHNTGITIAPSGLYTINVTLSGAQEVPPAASPGTGTLTGTYDEVTNIIDFSLVFSGLLSPTNNAHFHAPAPRGVNAPVIIGFVPGFPLGVTSGNYDTTFTLTPGQETDLLAGLVYVNIHTNLFPGGEIRAQLDTVGGGTLPVELSSFASNVLKNNVTLNWSTVIEVNNSGFDIQRKSSESTEWTSVGYVTGYGNSNQVINYSFVDRGLNNGSYNYRLKQIDINGNFEYYNLQNEVIIGVPVNYNLAQNYPNPFNPTTRIDFDIPENANVKIKIFDVNGREVFTLLNDIRPAGYYSIQVNADNFSSGVYYYTLTAGSFISTKKMIVLK